MSDPWEDLDNEVPDCYRDPNYHPFDHASPEAQKTIMAIQRYNLALLEQHSMLPDGARLYLDEHGAIQRAGAPPVDTTSGPGNYMVEELWGPGAEAGVAWRLIDEAPIMKHETWAATQRKLLMHFGPPYYKNSLMVTVLLRIAASEERECWVKLGALKSAHSLETVAALDIEAILVSMCSLAGVTPRKGDPTQAVEKVHYQLSDGMVLLRRIHQRLQLHSQEADTKAAGAHDTEATMQEELERFRAC